MPKRKVKVVPGVVFIDRLTNIFVESMRALVIALLCYGALEIVVVLLLLF